MAIEFIENFAGPGLGVALAASFALATAPVTDAVNAYGPAIETVSEAVAGENAARLFLQADRNGDRAIDRDEFGALAVVSAELARLNGFVAIHLASASHRAELPVGSPKAMTSAERTRIWAVATNEFLAAAGGDGLLDESEFVGLQLSTFRQADRNGDGRLDGAEVKWFAAAQGRLLTSDA